MSRPKSALISCTHCGAKTTNLKYCSNACQKSFEWAGRLKEMELTGCVPNGSIRAGRRYLIAKQGCCCAICRRRRWRGKTIPLVLDHIDGNAGDWRLSNLRYICPNCDAQLPTFKSRNRGKGRAMRRQRYKMGLSY